MQHVLVAATTLLNGFVCCLSQNLQKVRGRLAWQGGWWRSRDWEYKCVRWLLEWITGGSSPQKLWSCCLICLFWLSCNVVLVVGVCTFTRSTFLSRTVQTCRERTSWHPHFTLPVCSGLPGVDITHTLCFSVFLKLINLSQLWKLVFEICWRWYTISCGLRPQLGETD